MKSSKTRKNFVLRFRAVNHDTFLAIKAGKKKIETRAATKRYRDISAGDMLTFVCGQQRFSKEVKRAAHFKTIGAMLKKYEPSLINPAATSEKELRAMYASFPAYQQKIKDNGLMAWEI